MEGLGKKYVYRDGVRFEETPDGLFYAPEAPPSSKKHPCPDCGFCQWCADVRCGLCRENPHNESPKDIEPFKMV